MGEVRAKVKLTNFGDTILAELNHLSPEKIRIEEADCLVDSGAVEILLPMELVEKLGLKLIDKRLVRYADERIEELGMYGGFELELLGRKDIFSCFGGKYGSEPLLGQVVLEKLDLIVDCARQTLGVRKESPYLAMIKMK